MSSKFSCDLAEKLWERTLDSLHDEEAGDSGFGGWFALFRKEGAILSIDSQGFVSLSLPSDLASSWKSVTDQCAWDELGCLNQSCDGLFFILDTARHAGDVPDFEDVVQHIEKCETCDSLGNYLEI